MAQTHGYQLVDSHAHLDDDCFEPDRAAMLQRAQAAGVTIQIIPAISTARWSRLRQVCAQYEGLYPAYGLHPMYLAEHCTAHLDVLADWLQHEPAVAVGECGLDYFVGGLDKARQIDFFTAQIRLAQQFDLPLIIHARRAVDDVIKYLRRSDTHGVVHSFSGSEQQARQLIDLGFYLGFGGPITWPRANRLRRLIQILPLESILLETDAPDQPMMAYRGERNEPAFLPAVLHTVAELRQQPAANIADITTNNALNLFSISL